MRAKSWLWFIRTPWAMPAYVIVQGSLNIPMLTVGPGRVFAWIALALTALVYWMVRRDRQLDRKGKFL